jgi:hypothetical protein
MTDINSIQPLRMWLLGKFVPNKSALTVVGSDNFIGGKIYAVKVGPEVKGIEPGDRLFLAQFIPPTVLGKADGIEDEPGGEKTFLVSADQVIAVCKEAYAELGSVN